MVNTFTEYNVKTIAIDSNDKTSMGGLKAAVDYNINEYSNFSHLAMLIIPGGLSWEENDYDGIAQFVSRIRKLKIPISAICGATYFLCKHGFLDDIKHTGNSLEQFETVKRYEGKEHYLHAQIVSDDGIITVNETAAVEFAYEIFKGLKVDSPEEIKQWFDNFQNGTVHY